MLTNEGILKQTMAAREKQEIMNEVQDILLIVDKDLAQKHLIRFVKKYKN